ncbi:putative inner membrane transporter YedA [Enhygromyxa salina]|uniref:Putative inner membrane transporter YedA n=1 Tax=Enhygromyxa salina TaxID=215803 RepID=A0A2S9YG70_9BACT|nr:putative inner membrane transporter YedA [Enhygromyxa salina]
MVVLCVIWGSTWFVIKDGLERLPPFLSAGARFVVAGVIMAGASVVLGEREGGEDPPAWLWVVVGTSNFALSYGVIYVVQQQLPSGLVSVLWAVYPLMMAVCGHVFLPGERLRPIHWLGFLFGFSGMLLLFQGDLASFGGQGRQLALLLLISPAASAVGTTLLKRHGAQMSSLRINRNAMLLGGAQLLGISTLCAEPLTQGWSPAAIAGMLYLAVFGTVVTLGLYYWVLRYVPASRLSLIAFVTPTIALAIGWAVADEPIYWTTIVGAASIIAGIAIATRAARPSSEGALPTSMK